MTDTASLCEVEREVVDCRRCPRLVAWREEVARVRRAAFASEEYWGRPLPGFGDPEASVLVLGLAPAAHGGNRTGRIFTGDRSGDWLFGSMYRTGFANQPASVARDDGLRLTGAWVTAAVRCAPPANRPTPVERDNCLPYVVRELSLLENVRVIVTLGDAPRITPEVIALFVDAEPGTRAVYYGQPGHPVVLGPREIAALASVKGDRGARDLLRGGPVIECGELCSGRDVDTPEDLEAMRHEARAVL